MAGTISAPAVEPCNHPLRQPLKTAVNNPEQVTFSNLHLYTSMYIVY